MLIAVTALRKLLKMHAQTSATNSSEIMPALGGNCSDGAVTTQLGGTGADKRANFIYLVCLYHIKRGASHETINSHTIARS